MNKIQFVVVSEVNGKRYKIQFKQEIFNLLQVHHVVSHIQKSAPELTSEFDLFFNDQILVNNQLVIVYGIQQGSVISLRQRRKHSVEDIQKTMKLFQPIQQQAIQQNYVQHQTIEPQVQNTYSPMQNQIQTNKFLNQNTLFEQLIEPAIQQHMQENLYQNQQLTAKEIERNMLRHQLEVLNSASSRQNLSIDEMQKFFDQQQSILTKIKQLDQADFNMVKPVYKQVQQQINESNSTKSLEHSDAKSEKLTAKQQPHPELSSEVSFNVEMISSKAVVRVAKPKLPKPKSLNNQIQSAQIELKVAEQMDRKRSISDAPRQSESEEFAVQSVVVSQQAKRSISNKNSGKLTAKKQEKQPKAFDVATPNILKGPVSGFGTPPQNLTSSNVDVSTILIRTPKRMKVQIKQDEVEQDFSIIPQLQESRNEPKEQQYSIQQPNSASHGQRQTYSQQVSNSQAVNFVQKPSGAYAESAGIAELKDEVSALRTQLMMLQNTQRQTYSQNQQEQVNIAQSIRPDVALGQDFSLSARPEDIKHSLTDELPKSVVNFPHLDQDIQQETQNQANYQQTQYPRNAQQNWAKQTNNLNQPVQVPSFQNQQDINIFLQAANNHQQYNQQQLGLNPNQPTHTSDQVPTEVVRYISPNTEVENSIIRQLRAQEAMEAAELEQLMLDVAAADSQLTIDRQDFEISQQMVQAANMAKSQLVSEIQTLEKSQETAEILENRIIFFKLAAQQKKVLELNCRGQLVSKERQSLHNQLEDLRGNIRVLVRLRPSFAQEPQNNYFATNPTQVQYQDQMLNFYRVYDKDTSQQQLFKDAAPVLQSFIDGYNVALMCYGGTGSGKTFTLIGDDGDSPVCAAPGDRYARLGLLPRSVVEVFKIIGQQKLKCELSLEMLELYCDQLTDLLVVEGENLPKPVIQNQQIQNLKRVRVGSADALIQTLGQGLERRSTRATRLNERSSRSHTLVYLHLQTSSFKSVLVFVDLAGSERAEKSGSAGQAFEEMRHINQSLSCLGNCISSLSQKKPFVPFRDNKLTQLLQNCLGGNSKTLLFVNAAPFNFQETVSSLQFGARAKAVQNVNIKGKFE